MSERDENLVQDETAERLQAGGEAITGHLDGIDAEGRVLFRPDGEQAGVPAMIGLELDDARLVRAAWLGSRALALRTGGAGGQDGRLVLVALVRERVAAAARDALPGELQVKLDGDTLRLSARRRLELVCGKTRLVLDEDGRLELNGTYLLQRSRGPIKLKGATIELN